MNNAAFLSKQKFDLLAPFIGGEPAPVIGGEAAPALIERIPTYVGRFAAALRPTRRNISTQTADVLQNGQDGTAANTVAFTVATYREVETDQPHASDANLASIEALRTLSQLSVNWNGEGAPQPNASVMHAAIALLKAAELSDTAFAAALTSDSLPILFLRHPDWTGEIEFHSTSHLSFEFTRRDEPDTVVEGYYLPFGRLTLPHLLVSAIRNL